MPTSAQTGRRPVRWPMARLTGGAGGIAGKTAQAIDFFAVWWYHFFNYNESRGAVLKSSIRREGFTGLGCLRKAPPPKSAEV